MIIGEFQIDDCELQVGSHIQSDAVVNFPDQTDFAGGFIVKYSLKSYYTDFLPFSIMFLCLIFFNFFWLEKFIAKECKSQRAWVIYSIFLVATTDIKTIKRR